MAKTPRKARGEGRNTEQLQHQPQRARKIAGREEVEKGGEEEETDAPWIGCEKIDPSVQVELLGSDCSSLPGL